MARLLNPLRKMIQSKLTEIEGLESGIIVSQDLVETGRYYFGYDIRTSLNRRDLSYDNEQYTVSLVGYLSTKGGTQRWVQTIFITLHKKNLTIT